MSKIISSGKRKRAIAKAVLEEGEGRVWINKQDYKTIHFFDRLKMEEPLRIAENILGKLNFDVSISVKGGGEKGQIEAARVALAKVISQFAKSEELTKAFMDYDRNLLVADVRRKETYKPGDSKARSRRQKSYR
ncbi:30S ribosomal protein S9 [Candidatus Pacearchaeota archaeon RBG_19FT_COMBO_34_9]|nr:MAG: 30S ribosomal protein S9 [Candidatus Pacearchaeota archaeon RBG_19FT_COMBO_34_9]OGJ16888.1 MAG: 30S ribosomal protein S9 [Candidatus Pacearchaeota archaeon RBG_13_33_26]